MFEALIDLSWKQREPPLPPTAMVLKGKNARQFARRIASERLANFRGLVYEDGAPLLFLTGNELPWHEGVIYLGACQSAPALFVPPALEASVPYAWLHGAIEKAYGPGSWALLGPGGPLLSLAGLTSLNPELLRAWGENE